jgi:ribosomal protein L11 methylase PrmA
MEEEDTWVPPFVDSSPFEGLNELWENEKYVAPYMPTKHEKIQVMLEQVEWKPDDVFFDLGCGDGRVLISALRLGCSKGVGIDMDPKILAKAQANVEEAGLTSQISLIGQDMMEVDMTAATVIFMYLLPNGLNIILPKLIDLFENHKLRLVFSSLFEIKDCPYMCKEDTKWGYFSYYK